MDLVRLIARWQELFIEALSNIDYFVAAVVVFVDVVVVFVDVVVVFVDVVVVFVVVKKFTNDLNE
ncbi:hypothetical protein QR98_0007400 [Sarcoptes scabiei]|uniref:Uncharacterized protein n=1 Tax=Sarcoptes scabiei TaxID=52283 RepID=A0A131ZUY2_SARSC|nr:hypothetical protein QR98_0007400 [Sarcoptes scabiei]